MKQKLIFHIDVNNAYLSWTAVDLLKKGYKIDIRNKVSIIAGDESKRHDVVLAKSPLAKKYGIVTGESIFNARKKYKDLLIYPPDHTLYQNYSNMLYEYLCNLSPVVERYSVDECFLDMSGMKHFIQDEIEFANKIREEIKNKFGFTVNIGIGNNKLCAKVASDFEKPNKVHTLYDYEIKDKLWNLNVEDLFMVGRQTAKKLKSMKINTIYDLAHTPREKLVLEFKSFGNTLYEYANGIDNSVVESESADLKGIGNSITLPKDLDTIDEIKIKLLEIAEMVGSRLRKEKKYAYVVTLYVKYNDFKTLTHQKKLRNPINTDKEIFESAMFLLKEIELRPIRSLGIRLTSLTTEKITQISLFEQEKNNNPTEEALQETLDNLKLKYGKNIVKKAIIK